MKTHLTLRRIGNPMRRWLTWRHDASERVQQGIAAPPCHPRLGSWVSQDGYIRQRLLPNGHYEEDRGPRHRAATGRYSIADDHIDYVDDQGGVADGDFQNGVLQHAGMALYREPTALLPATPAPQYRPPVKAFLEFRKRE